MLFQFTSVGAAYFQNNFQGLILTQARFGSGVNYSPDADPSGLNGSTLYVTTPSAPVVVDANTVRYSVVLDSTVGPFDFGEVGFFIGNVLVAVGVNSNYIRKDLSIAGNNGNTIQLDLFVTKNGAQFYGALNVGSSDNQTRIPTVNTPDGLTPPNNVETNLFLVRGVPGIEVPYIASSDAQTGLWYFSNRPRQTYAGVVSGASPTAIDIPSPHGVTFSAASGYVLEFTSGRIRGYCRQLVAIGTTFFQWNTDLFVLPQNGDTFIIHGPDAAGSVGGLTANLNDLGDVTVASPTNNQVLTYETSTQQWKNKPSATGITTLAALTDVQLNSPTNNQAMLYDSVALKWKNGSISGLFTHNALGGLQGGAVGDYQHLTTAQSTSLVALIGQQYALKNVNNIFTKGQTVSTLPLNTANAYTINGGQSNNWSLTLGGSVTLPNPTAMTAGQGINIIIRQDGTGGRVLSFSPAFAFTGNATPSIALEPNAVSVLSGIWDASVNQLVCAIASGQLPGYVLPIASPTVLGGFKVGSGLAIAVDGTLSVSTVYTLPNASAGTLGGIKIGNTLLIDGAGIANVKTASALTLGVVRQGNGVTIDGTGSISATGVIATSTAPGTVMPGVGLQVALDGTLSVLGAQPLVNYATAARGAVPSTSTTVSGNPPALGIDIDDTTFAGFTSPVASNWYSVTLATARAVYQWRLVQGTGTQGATSAALQYFNGTTWVTVDTYTGTAADTGLRNLPTTTPAQAQWRVLANTGGAGQWRVYTLMLMSSNSGDVATTATAGIVKVGTGLSVTPDGTLSAPPYTLPTAGASTLGGIKIGTNLSIDGAGVVSSNFATVATSSVAGLVKVGTGLSIDGSGFLSATFALPIATTTLLGGIKQGAGLNINSSTGVASVQLALGSLTDVNAGTPSNADNIFWNSSTSKWVNGPNNYALPIAAAGVLGGVKVGTNLTIDGAGVLSSAGYTLPTAGVSTLGGVKIGTGLAIDGGGVLSATYSLPNASSSVLGGVKVGSTLTISGGGVLDLTDIYVNDSDRGVASGIAELDTNARLKNGQHPLAVLYALTGNHTIQSSEAFGRFHSTGSSARNLTIDTNANQAIPIGTFITGAQIDSGQVTIVAASGVTLNYSASTLPKTNDQGSAFWLYKSGADEWDLTGDLAPSSGLAGPYSPGPVFAAFDLQTTGVNGSTTFTDSGSRALTVTAVNGVTIQGNRASFATSGDALILASDPYGHSNLGIKNFIWTWKFKTAATNSYCTFFQHKGVAGDASTGSYIMLINTGSNNGNLAFYAGDLGAPVFTSSTGGFNDNVEHTAILKRIGSTMTLDIDGSIVASSSTAIAAIAGAAQDLNIGFDAYNAGREFVGTMGLIKLTLNNLS